MKSSKPFPPTLTADDCITLLHSLDDSEAAGRALYQSALDDIAAGRNDKAVEKLRPLLNAIPPDTYAPLRAKLEALKAKAEDEGRWR